MGERKKQEIQKLWENYKGLSYAKWEHQKEKKTKKQRILEEIMTKNSQINVTPQTRDPARSENTKLNKCKTNEQNKTTPHLDISYSNCRKSKIKQKSSRSLEMWGRREETPYLHRNRDMITSHFFSETMEARRVESINI